MEDIALAIKLIGGKDKNDPDLQLSMHMLAQMMGKESERLNAATKINEPLDSLVNQRAGILSTVDYLYEQMFILNNAANVEEGFRRTASDSTSSAAAVNTAILKGLVWKKRGTVLLKQAKYAEAREAYMAAMWATMRVDVSYPLLGPNASREAINTVGNDCGVGDMFACANNIAHCFTKENDIVHVSGNISLRAL